MSALCLTDLDDPPLGQHDEALLVVAAADDGQHQVQHGRAPAHQHAGVSAVRPYAPEPVMAPCGPGEEVLGRVAVPRRGGGDHDGQDQAEGVHHDVPLTALDVFFPPS